jgi:sugar (pentulose or hexulose) kinase
MTADRAALLGVDVGTQGIRVVAVDPRGDLLSSHEQAFPLQDRTERHEQSSELWWDVSVNLLRAVATELRDVDEPAQPVALSVTSTSGTVIPLDAARQPLHPALMYDDPRASAQAERCRLASTHGDEPGIPFGASYGLPKMLWYTETHPREAKRIASWCHAADFLLGRLSGVWGVTDPTNALKTGYDPERDEWPAFISEALGMPASWFPRVQSSGSVLGPLREVVAAETGLPPTLFVTTGMTDGCASQIAAGAVQPGEWSTTVGTTLVIKGVTRDLIRDPLGRVYSHRHPQGWWMPGGASNTGADWAARDYAGQDLSQLDREARAVIPTPWTVYPLLRAGERFPFIAPRARGFEPEGLGEPERYAARMEGVAYLERLAYEMLEGLSGERVARVSTAGGGSRGETWLTIRANVLRKPIVRMRHPEAAVGAAILAASGTLYDGLGEAAAAMTEVEREVAPDSLAAAYDSGYAHFVTALTERGYLTPAPSPP